MRKATVRNFAAALTLAVGLAACVVDNPVRLPDNDVRNYTATPGDVTLPTTDQLSVKVTANLPTAVLGTFEEGSTGAALVKRLPSVTNAIGPDTRLVLVPGSLFDSGSSLTAEQLEAIARLSLNGGYLAIERPTGQQLLDFGVMYVAELEKLQKLQYEQLFEVDEAAAARAAAQSQAVERFRTRQANIAGMAKTRADGGDALSEVEAEMMILGPVDYFSQEPFADEVTTYTHSEDSEGNATEPVAVTTKQERTAYVSGVLADAAAEWLNATVKKYEQQSAARRALTRGSGSTAINDLTSASEEFTYNEAIDWKNTSNYTFHYANRVNMIVRSWGVHNMDWNKDFYYLKQDVTLKMGALNGQKIFWPLEENYWYQTTSYGNYKDWYGAFLSQYVTSMNLTGSGSIRLEAAMPSTDNGQSSTSVSAGTSSSSTTTTGSSIGGSFGFSGDNPSGSINYSVSQSKGYTNGTSFSMSASQTHKDFGATKNTSGTKVTWTYKGTLPQFYITGEYCHQTAASILVNDCDVANEACWSVSNPSGQYTYNITSQPQTAALLYQNDGSSNAPHKYEYTTTATANHSQRMLQPNRANQSWRMNITIDEWAGSINAGALNALQESIEGQFPDLYASKFTVADKTATSLTTITNVINYAKRIFSQDLDILQSYASSYGVKKFTIHWRCDDTNIKTREGFTVTVN